MDISAESVRAVFERRRQDPYEPRLAGVTGSYRFDVLGVGSFRVAVDDGHLFIDEETREADCVIACGAEELLGLAHGSLHLITAAMQGLIEVRGDLSLAQKLHGILPTPTQAEAQP